MRHSLLMYNFFPSPEMDEDGMNDYVDAAVQQTGATPNPVHQTMDHSHQTDQMTQPTAPAKDEKADPEAMDTDEGYTVDLAKMKMNVVEGGARTWSGPTSSATAGDLIYNLAGPAYDYCMTNCLLYTSPSPRDGLLSRMPSSA